MRWGNVDLDNARLNVKAQLAGVDGNGGPIFSPPKTERGRRTIDLDRVTVEALRARRRIQLEERMAFGAMYHDHGLVFTSIDGQPVVGDDISNVFYRLSKKARVPRIRFRDLRHSPASHLFAAGVDVKSVSSRLGHASASFTLDTYGHVMPGQQAQAAARVAEMVDG